MMCETALEKDLAEENKVVRQENRRLRSRINNLKAEIVATKQALALLQKPCELSKIVIPCDTVSGFDDECCGVLEVMDERPGILKCNECGKFYGIKLLGVKQC